MLSDYFYHIEFKYPWVLWLLAMLPLLWLAWKYLAKNSESVMLVSTTATLSGGSWKNLLRQCLPIMRLLTLAALLVALARPRQFNDTDIVNNEGIDIMLCLDVSGSMGAEDLQPTRLEAAKEVAAEFVRRRPNDRIGLVVFSAEAFTSCPVTTNHDFLINIIYEISGGLLNVLKDGTHIGEGLASAASGLEKSNAKSKVIVLLTDGVNDPNGQDVSPEEAKELAKAFGVKVYTIGAGTDGRAPIKKMLSSGEVVQSYMDNAIDEGLLKKIATETGGKYFRAKDNDGLKTIYGEIDQMEKVKIESTRFRKYQERFFPFVWLAAGLLFIELLLRFTVLRKFP
jgi:Ca-activated chloride channel homolog